MRRISQSVRGSCHISRRKRAWWPPGRKQFEIWQFQRGSFKLIFFVSRVHTLVIFQNRLHFSPLQTPRIAMCWKARIPRVLVLRIYAIVMSCICWVDGVYAVWEVGWCWMLDCTWRWRGARCRATINAESLVRPKRKGTRGWKARRIPKARCLRSIANVGDGPLELGFPNNHSRVASKLMWCWCLFRDVANKNARNWLVEAPMLTRDPFLYQHVIYSRLNY